MRLSIILILMLLTGIASAAPLAPNDEIVRSFGDAPLRHPAAIIHLSVSNDGKRLATLAGDGQLRLWDADSGKLIAAREQTVQGVQQLLFSGDGKTIVVSDQARGMTLYRGDELADVKQVVKNGKNANVFFGTQCVAISPDGTLLARPTLDRGIGLEIVDLKQNKSVRRIDTNTGIPQSLTFRDDNSLALLSPDGNMQFFGADGKSLGIQRVPRSVHAMGHPAVLLPGAKHVAFVDDKQHLFMAEVGAGDKELTAVRLVENKQIGIIYPATSDRFIVCADVQGQAMSLIDIVEKKDVTENIQTAGNARQFAANLVMSGDGRRLFVGKGLNCVRVIDTSTWQGAVQVFGHTGAISKIAVSPDGSKLISASADGSLRMWDRMSGKQVQSVEGVTVSAAPFAVTSNGDLFTLSANAKQILRPDGDAVKKVDLDQKQKSSRPPMIVGASRSPVAGVLLSASQLTTSVTLFDLSNNQPNRSVDLRSKLAISRPFLSPAANGLLGIGGNSLAIYDLRAPATQPTTTATALEPLFTTSLPAATDTATPAFVGGWDFLLIPNTSRNQNQPEARIIEAYSALEMLKLETGAPKANEAGKANRINQQAIFQMNGEIQQQVGATMTAAACSPDLRLLVTASPVDRRLHLWDAATGKLLHTTAPAPSAVSAITFSSDSKSLFTGGGDGSLNEWKLPANLLPQIEPATTDQIAQAVRDLASERPSEAYAAVQLLARAGDAAVPLLKDAVAPPRLDQANYDRLIKSLDADTFKERRRAADDLVLLGPIAVAALRNTAAQTPSDEVYNSIQGILSRIQKGEKTAPAILSRLRAAHVLQRIGTTAAKDALTAAAQPDQPPVVLFRVRLACESLP